MPQIKLYLYYTLPGVCTPGAVLGKIFGWPLIIREATTAKRNYYRTNYITYVEKLGLNYPEKNWERVSNIWGACAPCPQHRTATLVLHECFLCVLSVCFYQTSVLEVNTPSRNASGGIHLTGSIARPPLR